MQETISIFNINRKIYLDLLHHFSLEQLNKIPEGFNNNIIWNIAHIVATQQILLYQLSGTKCSVTQDFILKYKKGTKPEAPVNELELEQIKTFLISTTQALDTDYKNSAFGTYQPYTTSQGFELTSIQDAIAFNNYHEGMHLGIILSLRKFV